MFKKTNKDVQLDAFSGVPGMLSNRSFKQYNDARKWHNLFRHQVVNRIDESLFKVLFNESMGAPNAPISVLVGMMILKESFGWSDSQLFEQGRFNLLVRSALGLYNLNEEIPAASTYYLLRNKIHAYNKEHNDDLFERVFKKITEGQIKEFSVDGRSIRMDSKLIGSNIAVFSRYEIIHSTLILFYKSLEESRIKQIGKKLRIRLNEIADEESQKVVYRSTREEINRKIKELGELIYQVLRAVKDESNEYYHLLKRVFNEQYKVLDGNVVELRPKEEIQSHSVQSPHDPECAYRNKGDQKVKGYSVNITETNSQTSLNLITSVQVDKANVADTSFVESAVESTRELTGQPIEKVYADGAYQQPENDLIGENIDMVYTGIQGSTPRFELEMTIEGLRVIDTKTGELFIAQLSRKTCRSKQNSWYIEVDNERIYFKPKAIRASLLRRQLRERPPEELRKRNNVEATIYHLGHTLRKGKTKYRGLFKQKVWAICRSLWINLVRIVNYLNIKWENSPDGAESESFLLCKRSDIVPPCQMKKRLQSRILIQAIYLLVLKLSFAKLGMAHP